MSDLPDWQNKSFLVLATPKRPSNGYPFGLEMESDDGTRELHGPFSTPSDAHAYRARLMTVYSYQRGKIVKIETPAMWANEANAFDFPSVLVTVERTSGGSNDAVSSGTSGGEQAHEILIMAMDYTGLPRAWATGPISMRREVEARVRRELQSYCEKQKGLGEIDLANYSKYTFKLNVIARCPHCENTRSLLGHNTLGQTCGASECQEASYRANGGKRFVGEIVKLTRDCELGAKDERAQVTEIEGIYMTLDFFERAAEERTMKTGADYRFLREVK